MANFQKRQIGYSNNFINKLLSVQSFSQKKNNRITIEPLKNNEIISLKKTIFCCPILPTLNNKRCPQCRNAEHAIKNIKSAKESNVRFFSKHEYSLISIDHFRYISSNIKNPYYY